MVKKTAWKRTTVVVLVMIVIFGVGLMIWRRMPSMGNMLHHKKVVMHNIASSQELNDLLQKVQGPIVLKLFQTGCPACEMMKSRVKELSQSAEFKNVMFVAVDLAAVSGEDANAIVEKYHVAAVPTFIFVQGGQEVGRYLGGCEGSVLRDEIKKAFGTLS